VKEWTEIYEQMRGTFAQRAGFVPSEGCDSAVRLYALAAELQSLLMQADWVLDQSFPQTAQGMRSRRRSRRKTPPGSCTAPRRSASPTAA